MFKEVFLLFFLTSCYFAATSITAPLPALTPSFDDPYPLNSALWAGIDSALGQVKYTATPVTDKGNQIPKNCYDEVQSAGYGKTCNVDVYSVTFNDLSAALSAGVP